MALLKPLGPEEAPEPARSALEGLARARGRVLNFFGTLAHKPEVLAHFLPFYQEVMRPGALDARLKELAYLQVSIQNGCAYWTRAHTASAKRAGVTEEQIQALKEPGGLEAPLWTEAERALLRYAQRLTARPGAIGPEDLEALTRHFSPEQILELALVVASANWTNRINDGLQVEVDT